MEKDLYAALMGVVEGITEFLPISSTGHLILTGHFTGFEEMLGSKELADAFEVIIQFGAILAVVAAYPRRFIGLLRFGDNRGFSGLRGIGLLLITTIPASILGFLVHKPMHKYLFDTRWVALALATGAIWILVVESWRPRTKVEGIDSLGWKQALGVGLFQCASLWPGMSRSASTILGGMLTGIDRKTATEYSFFAAVPIMTAATFFELFKFRHILNASHIRPFAIGFVVSFIFAWISVKFLIHFLSRHTLVPFGWYRLALSGAVLWWWLAGGRAT